MIKKALIIAFLGIFLVGCGSSKRASKNRVSTRPSSAVINTESRRDAPAETNRATETAVTTASYATVNDYIDAFAEIAKEEMRLYKVPASITMAQAVLESGAGKGALTLKANNHFGIKCHNWTGAVVYHDDDEKGECFRKYSDPKFSFRDHSLFLTGRSRYAALFKLEPDDYKGWAKGLRAAGYATDPKYPEKLISIIERYAMYNYDAEVLGKQIRENAGEPLSTVTLHTVRQGETIYSISKLYGMTQEDLRKENGLKDNSIKIGQQLKVVPEYKGF